MKEIARDLKEIASDTKEIASDLNKADGERHTTQRATEDSELKMVFSEYTKRARGRRHFARKTVTPLY